MRNLLLSRPIREFIGGVTLMRKLRVSRSRVYVLLQEGKIAPAPIKVDGMFLFHRTTKRVKPK